MQEIRLLGMRYGSLSRYAHLDLFLGRDPALFEISRRYPTGCACRLSRTTQFRISPVDLDIPKQETPAYSPQAAAIEPRKVCRDSKISVDSVKDFVYRISTTSQLNASLEQPLGGLDVSGSCERK